MATGIHDWCSRYLSRLHPEDEKSPTSLRSTSVDGSGRSVQKVENRNAERFKTMLTWISAILTVGIMPGVVWITKRLTQISPSSQDTKGIKNVFTKTIPPRTQPPLKQSPFDTQEGKEKIKTIENWLTLLLQQMEEGQQKTMIKEFVADLSFCRDPPIIMDSEEFDVSAFKIDIAASERALKRVLQYKDDVFSFVEEQARNLPDSKWVDVQRLFEEVELLQHVSKLPDQ